MWNRLAWSKLNQTWMCLTSFRGIKAWLMLVFFHQKNHADLFRLARIIRCASGMSARASSLKAHSSHLRLGLLILTRTIQILLQVINRAKSSSGPYPSRKKSNRLKICTTQAKWHVWSSLQMVRSSLRLARIIRSKLSICAQVILYTRWSIVTWWSHRLSARSLSHQTANTASWAVTWEVFLFSI